MTIDTIDLMNSIADSLEKMQFIRAEEIPNIDLYMDQVTSFLDEGLKSSQRENKEEHIITKTMINNYTKNNVIEAPVKKKYSKEHILLLILVYYLKSFLQISDIKELIDPIRKKYFNVENGPDIEDIYKCIFADVEDKFPIIREEILEEYKASEHTFKEAGFEDESLQMFSFVCRLSCDIYVRKLMVEKIIDSYKKTEVNDSNIKEKNKEKSAAKQD